MLELAAKEGASEITTTLQIFASYLSPEVIDVSTRLLYSDFLRFRLVHIREIVLANTHGGANRPVPFFCVAADDSARNSDYEEFWRLLANAVELCGAKMNAAGVPSFG